MIFVVAMSFAVLAALLSRSPGEIRITWLGWQVEMSVVTMVMIGFAFIVLYILWRYLVRFLRA